MASFEPCTAQVRLPPAGRGPALHSDPAKSDPAWASRAGLVRVLGHSPFAAPDASARRGSNGRVLALKLVRSLPQERGVELRAALASVFLLPCPS